MYVLYQAPTPAPPPPPANITVLSSAHRTSSYYLISPTTKLQLRAESTQTVDTYNWSTSNTTIASCLSAAGPYLSIPSLCFTAGALYLVRVTLTPASGSLMAGQVSLFSTLP